MSKGLNMPASKEIAEEPSSGRPSRRSVLGGLAASLVLLGGSGANGASEAYFPIRERHEEG
jgi:hypothetical protein